MTQLFSALRRQLNTGRRDHPRTTTAPRIHLRASPARARVNDNCTALRCAILGTQLVLRTHVLRALNRLGAYRRDGQRRARCEPREDLSLGCAMGDGA
jgi:hypothetical protein